jgi:glycosyltransferase involved in cell wall biosynthesis
MNTFQVAAVVIGRNEGDRLERCLVSLQQSISKIVYVDSGSTDNSVARAKAMGIDVVELDMLIPFTAARARNEGVLFLRQTYPDLTYIQFVDGDCEVQTDWVSTALDFLNNNPDYAVACGRRRERFPDASNYNRLCDIEWDTPIGDAAACGGDALMRLSAFVSADGYRNELIAGEEPELCFRLRNSGWKIRRIDAEMTLHDAAMTKLSQWWNRAKRAGYAYASSWDLHMDSGENYKFKEIKSLFFWMAIMPIFILTLSFINTFFIFLIMIYPVQILRIVKNSYSRQNLAIKSAFLYGLSAMFAKLPQFIGVLKFYINKINGRNGVIIEYK